MSSKNITTVSNGVHGNPLVLASHENVVEDIVLFWTTLRNFHFLSGTKLSVPVMAGRELDLHLLYVGVTRIGGFDKVVAEKRWREVGRLLGFAPVVNSSAPLKKHYNTLLRGYESMYFFRNDDPKLQQTEIIPPFEAEGVIDARFDCGYLITMKIGDQVLRGVIYHPDYPAIAIALAPIPALAPEPAIARSPAPPYENAIVPYVPPPPYNN